MKNAGLEKYAHPLYIKFFAELSFKKATVSPSERTQKK